MSQTSPHERREYCRESLLSRKYFRLACEGCNPFSRGHPCSRKEAPKLFQAAKRNAATKKSLPSKTRRQPMFPEAKREAATVKSPSPKGMEKSVHVRVKRVLPEAKLHKREEDAGLRACSQGGIPFPFVRAPALFTRTSVFQKKKRQEPSCVPEEKRQEQCYKQRLSYIPAVCLAILSQSYLVMS